MEEVLWLWLGLGGGSGQASLAVYALDLSAC